jgi:hypothetical protein
MNKAEKMLERAIEVIAGDNCCPEIFPEANCYNGNTCKMTFDDYKACWRKYLERSVGENG